MKIDSKIGNLNLEQGFLILALVLLTGAGLYEAFTYEGAEQKITGRAAVAPPVKDAKAVSDVATGLMDAPVVKPREHNLFIPRLITLNPDTGNIKVLEWDVPMQDGIPPRWKQKYGLPIDDPTVATSDDDGDGYNNKEEYDAQTDPHDKASAPPVIRKLYVKNYTAVQLQIVFKGYNETEPGSGVYEYQINTPTLAKRSWRLKEGDVIKVDEFNKYVIGKFREIKKMVMNKRTGIEEEKNLSELDVTDPRLNETITLIYNTPQNSDQSTVGFELHVPGEFPDPDSVQIGKKFKVRGTEYQLRRADNDSAVILDLSTNKEITITRAGTTPAPAPDPTAGTPPPAPAAPTP